MASIIDSGLGLTILDFSSSPVRDGCLTIKSRSPLAPGLFHSHQKSQMMGRVGEKERGRRGIGGMTEKLK
ncbi:hypothetical protein CP500_022615, partial [Tychonema bourrellyi FEM_GT703]